MDFILHNLVRLSGFLHLCVLDFLNYCLTLVDVNEKIVQMLRNLYAAATYESSTTILTRIQSDVCLCWLLLLFNKSLRTRDSLHLPYIPMVVLNLIIVAYFVIRTVKLSERVPLLMSVFKKRNLQMYMLFHFTAK